jgi:hypothetical protein
MMEVLSISIVAAIYYSQHMKQAPASVLIYRDSALYEVVNECYIQHVMLTAVHSADSCRQHTRCAQCVELHTNMHTTINTCHELL